MRHVALALGLLVAGQVFQSGCAANVRRGEPMSRPMAIDSPELKLGQRVFMAKCQTCHPGGEGGIGVALNNKPLPEALIKLQVRLGLSAMPAFGEDEISNEELDALAAYVVALRQSKPAPPHEGQQ